ncbi:MAG: metallophosphoesterase [Chloroflexi bacterium]|jgi:predicted phosphodiesterase|uniref:Metallophosphoesterase n=1 Tax=Candidatus Thermofonsia Clade 3 bacterium TaxID=2364212 RepID=A0A2M8QFX6_9CHLR|nr:metallophosphoesterase [Candidatus Roseilinea sp. NK_OTU-006]PJF48707.1 MAG: metallophosphoesterase [Candidatus Thermofonsia Clade 3 bacterium]RMG64139.1 MAG: metallophosphoesterase [Chloroflexota bacterium]
MKLAVLSDIHGNYPALLNAVEHVEVWRPDVVVIAGDTVNRGPRSADCLNLVLAKARAAGWLMVIGNHEEYVIAQSKPDCPTVGPQAEIQRASRWTYEQLNRDVSALEAMPFARELPGPAGDARITHASMLGTRDGVYPQTTDDELPPKLGQPLPAVFCVGHTHQPLTRTLNGTLVVNAGSVGLPFDGDWRLSYAQVTCHSGRWHARIVRLAYDRQQAERDFYETGFLDEGGALARVMLRELQIASGLIYGWAKEFEQPVRSGEITLEQSVERFLRRY